MFRTTVGEVKGCCCGWKSVGVIIDVDCGVECGVSGTCMYVVYSVYYCMWRISCSVRG